MGDKYKKKYKEAKNLLAEVTNQLITLRLQIKDLKGERDAGSSKGNKKAPPTVKKTVKKAVKKAVKKTVKKKVAKKRN